MGADKKYEHVITFLSAYLIQSSHRSNIFLLKRSVIFPQDVVWIYNTTASVNENDVVTDLAGFGKRGNSSGLDSYPCRVLLLVLPAC